MNFITVAIFVIHVNYRVEKVENLGNDPLTHLVIKTVSLNISIMIIVKNVKLTFALAGNAQADAISESNNDKNGMFLVFCY